MSRWQWRIIFITEEKACNVFLGGRSEKNHFILRTGLQGIHEMNIGRGYERQLHFNEKFMPSQVGAGLALEVELS